MWDYKKLIKSRETRQKLLGLVSFVPDEAMLRVQYRLKTGRRLELKEPRRFTEKLQWYKLHYRDPLMHRLVNKYTVREYVKEKGLGELLVPLYAHYERMEDVDWDALPESFVIKTQHGGGGLNVVLVPDKSRADRDAILEKLRFEPGRLPDRRGGREWAYVGIERGLVVEELLINSADPASGLNDYKIFCYNGRARYIIVDADRYIGHKRNFYDLDWNDLHITSDYPAIGREIPRPENLDEMLRAAETLAGDFPFLRVDLYNVDGRIYFGELTFYPWSGYVPFDPDVWDFRFGEGFELRKCP